MGSGTPAARTARVMNWRAIVYYSVQTALAFLIMWACLHFCGCRCPECVTTTEVEKVVKVVERDTTIVTKADSASVSALLKCDSAYNVVLFELISIQGERIKAQANTKKQGKDLALTLDCKEDSLLTEIQLRDSIISTLRSNTTIVRERYVPNYYKNTSRGFWVLFVVLLLIVAWYGFKIYRKIVTGQIVWRL